MFELERKMCLMTLMTYKCTETRRKKKGRLEGNRKIRVSGFEICQRLS